MPKASDLASVLSQKPIVLIVEDRITKEYLYAIWGADQQHFNILTSGGHQVVTGTVQDLRKHGSKTVFGLIDKDFAQNNVARWSDPNSPPDIFRPSFHELENFLLDWEALAGCDLNQRRSRPSSAAEIENWAKSEAEKQPWWLACRKCLSALQQRHGHGFPSAPTVATMTNLQSAHDYIANSLWFSSLQATTNEILNNKHIEKQLNDAEGEYRLDLTSGKWIQTFSGKEIFNHILSRIHSIRPTPTAEPNVDLAKSVGKWQLAKQAIPPELDKLRHVMKNRVGIA